MPSWETYNELYFVLKQAKGRWKWQCLRQRVHGHHQAEYESNPEYSLARLMMKLKLQYFGHLMQTADSLEKILMLGKIEGSRRSGQQKMRWLDGIIDSIHMSLNKLWEIVKDREAWHDAAHGFTKSNT